MKIDPKYIAGWRKRFTEQEKESHALAQKAHSDLTKAVEILKKYGAKRILVYGSILRPERFHRRSDIDMAVEGIPSRDFIRASADLMMAMDWPVDLKPLEKVDDSFRAMILEKGEVIYAD
jgi:predicted nucleotidyltransferase